jgi:hypothetical protein
MSGFDFAHRLVKERIMAANAFEASALRIDRDAALNSSRL